MIYQFALRAAELAYNTRCENVVLLDMRGRSPVTEFFLIVTGTSQRQMRTVADEVELMGKNINFKPFQISGYDSARWIVVDFVHVVVHVFDVESREFYDLELLWGDAPRINWRAELGLPEEAFVKPAEKEAELYAPSEEEDMQDAQEEEARLEGSSEAGDEEAELLDEDETEADASVVVEVPDQESEDRSVQFVEIDSPGTRNKKDKARFPTPLHEAEGEETIHGETLAEQSQDEDAEERAVEKARDADPEATSEEDLPENRVSVRPIGGVSAGLSGAAFVEDNAEENDGDLEDGTQNREDVPPQPTRPVGRKLTTPAAPGRVNPKKAKGGVVKARKVAAKPAGKAVKKVKVAKVSKKAVAAKKAPKKVVAKKVAKKKAVAKKAPARKAPAKKVGTKKPAAKKTAAKRPAPAKATKKKTVKKVAKKSPARKSAKKKR